MNADHCDLFVVVAFFSRTKWAGESKQKSTLFKLLFRCIPIEIVIIVSSYSNWYLSRKIMVCAVITYSENIQFSYGNKSTKLRIVRFVVAVRVRAVSCVSRQKLKNNIKYDDVRVCLQILQRPKNTQKIKIHQLRYIWIICMSTTKSTNNENRDINSNETVNNCVMCIIRQTYIL